jgi:hypothetical protein
MRIFLFCALLLSFIQVTSQPVAKYDICIYGGNAAGVIAAYTAKMSGKSVLLIEPGKHLGGLTSGGLGYTDIGNKYVISGLARDFYRRVGQHYGKFEQWIFEPQVAENILRGYISRAKVPVWFDTRLQSVKKEGSKISSITLENSLNPQAPIRKVSAKIFLDCSYEGDLMAQAKVSYTIGREANAQYGETYNGVQLLDKHQLPDGIDPYRELGNPASGLLWGVSPAPLAAQGSADKSVQAYNFRICLSKDPQNQVPISQPADYDPARYELLLRIFALKQPRSLGACFKWDLMPNQKTDINNNGGFSTDMIGQNHHYPEADYATRKKFIRDLENYTKGLLYFVGNDPRVPEALRTEMQRWGYPKDEYTDNDHWSWQPYIREARRMLGAYVMTQHNCQGRETVNDAVGLAAYTMDSHNCQRIVHQGMVKNEGDVQIGGFPPYPIAYRALTPKKEECSNLLVPVCLSASHIAYGSIRMEPVFMVLAQAASAAACQALDEKKAVQDIQIDRLQAHLRQNPLADGSTAEVLIDNDITPNLVKIEGEWLLQKRGGSQFGGAYGAAMLMDTLGGSKAKQVSYRFEAAHAGQYQLMIYVPSVPKQATKLKVQVENGTQKAHFEPSITELRNDWLLVGTFLVKPGSPCLVKLMNQADGSATVADAILWVPIKDHRK